MTMELLFGLVSGRFLRYCSFNLLLLLLSSFLFSSFFPTSLFVFSFYSLAIDNFISAVLLFLLIAVSVVEEEFFSFFDSFDCIDSDSVFAVDAHYFGFAVWVGFRAVYEAWGTECLEDTKIIKKKIFKISKSYSRR